MKKKSKAGQTIVRLIDRIFGLFLAAGIVFGIFGLTLEWILLKGPSPALRDSFVMTMIWTRRFDFIPRIFLTEREVRDIYDAHFETNPTGASTDTSLITISVPEETDADLGPQPDAYGITDEDGDGIVILDVKKKGFVGKMMVVYDPSRITPQRRAS